MPGKSAENDHISQPLIVWEAEGNIEWHPIPDQEKAIDQVGVPAQFPALATNPLCATDSGRSAAATVAIPASPSRATIASI
jgi:hypothetical protein